MEGYDGARRGRGDLPEGEGRGGSGARLQMVQKGRGARKSGIWGNDGGMLVEGRAGTGASGRGHEGFFMASAGFGEQGR